MNTITIKINRTKELNDNTIHQINKLKNQHWKYNEIEHLRWFRENIRDDDIHLLICNDDILAYSDMANLIVTIDKTEYKMLGIGNVCVNNRIKGKGYGLLLMTAVNAVIKEMNSCGILLCHDELVKFYDKSGWKLCNAQKKICDGISYDNNILIYDPLMIVPQFIKEITFDRNF